MAATAPDIGLRVKALRRRLRVPQYVLARRLGVPATWLSEAERGLHPLSAARVAAIAEALGVPAAELAAEPVLSPPPGRRGALRIEVTLRAPALEAALERLAAAAERAAAAVEGGETGEPLETKGAGRGAGRQRGG